MDQEMLLEELKLSNGLTVWLSQDDSEPKVYGGMVVKAGAKDSPNSGIAHYFEHIMFKGTDTIGTINYEKEAPILDKIAEKYSELKSTTDEHQKTLIQKEINKLNIEAAQFAIPNDFNNLINKYGGAGLNAGTSYDYTIFFNTFTPQYLEHWCWLNSERMVTPVFRLFQSELETVYEEKNMYDDNFATTPTQKVFERVMAPHPYQYPIIGSSENLKTPDLHEMQAFFEKMYIAGNMALVLTGDFRREGLEELLEATFGRIQSGNVTHTTEYPKPAPFEGHQKLSIKLPIPMIKASGRLWHTVPSTHTDQIALTIIQDLLSNESKTGRLDKLILNNEVVEATAMNTALNDVGIFGFLVITKPMSSNSKGQRLVMQEIQHIIDGDISDEELRRTKLSLKRNYILQIESLEKRHRMLLMLFAQGSTWHEHQENWKRLEQLTVKDIADTAKKYLTENFLEIRKKTGTYKKHKLSKPPYDPITAPNSSAKSPFAEKLEKLDLQPLTLRTLDLQNDVKPVPLNSAGLAKLYRTENLYNDLFTLDLIYFRSRYHYSLIRHLSLYLELVGCERYSENEFYAKLQEIGATISFEDKENFFLIKVTGFDHYFHQTIELLHHFLYSPLAEPKKMSQLIQSKEISDKALRKDPNALSRRLLDEVMYGRNAGFHRQLTLSELKKLKPQELLTELSQVLATELDAHYTGKLPIEEVQQALVTTLNSEQVHKSWSDYLHLEANDNNHATIHFLHDSSATQAIIRGYMPIGVLTQSDLGTIRLLNQYYGGGMGSLLFQEIREYRSLAYGVGTSIDIPPFHRADELRSSIGFYLATQADKMVDALTLTDKLIHQAPTDTRRYDFAMEAMQSSIYNYYPSIRMRSRTIASLLRQGLKKDLPLVLMEELQEVTPAKLVDVHKQRIAQQPLTYTIVADRKIIDLKALSELAPIQEYTLKDLDL